MTPLSEKLRLSLYKSTLRLCESLARSLVDKTLAFPSLLLGAAMDDLFGTHSDDFDPFDLTSPSLPRLRPLNNQLRLLDDDADDYDSERIYLVPYRWWKEVQNDAEKIDGVSYAVSLRDNSVGEIALDLRKESNSGNSGEAVPGKRDNRGEGFSGLEYALVPEAIWLQALKRHTDSNAEVRDVGSCLAAEDYMQDVFPLQIRLSVSWETDLLVVKISLKDNTIDHYRRACNIFSSVSKLLRIWDFSGQTSLVLMNDKNTSRDNTSGQAGEEILLELQVHGLTYSNKYRGLRSNEMAVEHSGSVRMNGNTDDIDRYLTRSSSSLSGSSYRGAGFLGLKGLQNLGNTCFMNSAIQCLVHTPKLVDYFLGDYRNEINYVNPLGMNGEIALAFGDLLRKLWAPGASPVAPRTFKSKLAKLASQFSGYNQHDSQEFLAFLLDGLHEDLNRVKCKPYIENKDAEGCPDEVAEEYWRNHLARNDSIIVDLCQGQYRSTLVCPVCLKVSLTFDPLMYLSLQIPSTTMRTMTLTVLSTDGTTLPSPFTVSVPKCGRLKDLTEALSAACFLRNDETLLVAEIYKSRIFHLLKEPSGSLDLLRDEDQLVAYRIPKDSETSPLIVFMHHRPKNYETERSSQSEFGIPLVARLSDFSNGFDLRKQFMKLLNPFLMPIDDALNDKDDAGSTDKDDPEMEDAISPAVSNNDEGSDSETGDDTDFQFYIGSVELTESSKINMNQLVSISRSFDVDVFWSNKMIERYDTALLSSLPQIFRPQFFTERYQESVSLYKCLEAFLKVEPLGPDDMWCCPSCKKPRQASKKLDLWRLPEVLVIHLKRFSYSRFLKNKLETFVDFPIDDLDLSTYIIHKNSLVSNRYTLYAVSNHYGGMGGGHYTAFVHHANGQWYEFDDDKVFSVSKDRIKTAAAYVLFYRRVPNAS